MKKLIALVMMLCMLCGAAMAENESAMNWEDIFPQLEEMDVTGELILLEELGLMIFLPSGMNAVEVSEEDAAAGRLYLFMAEDQSSYIAVDAANVENLTLDQLYENTQKASGVSDVDLITMNGLNAVVYKNLDSDFWSGSLVDTNSNIINFVMGPASAENVKKLFPVLMASLQPAE